ncbi:Eco57I restriction-modification methylase domain-containing protein [Crocosphaera sp. UHCC 0190]|uniref:Eco57I restriction-modification methylase domain-containing protein n=1 Tax=Crocosphaera sp. UHCC 0190 TaxID=3110246 RepID=UPI003A5213E0
MKPRIIIANPPFAEDGNTQRAATFIRKALSWLENGSQFAFILPQSFLTNTTHGLSEARKLLTDSCQIHEVWQLPEGAVGIDAAQDVCIVSGTINNNSVRFPTIARAVLSRAKIENTKDSGFLGNTWVAKLNYDDESWSSVTTPIIKISVPTVPLGNLFYVFNGVTPNTTHKPISQCPPNTICKRK